MPSVKTSAGRTVRARSPAQSAYLDLMRTHPLVFGVGPAGPARPISPRPLARTCYTSGASSALILSRPALEAGERLGFPGDIREKIDPYLRPLYDALFETMGDMHSADGAGTSLRLAAARLYDGGALWRARLSFSDEAQNCTSAPDEDVFDAPG